MLNFSGLSNQTGLGKFLRSFLKVIPDDFTVRILQGRLRGMRWIAGASTHGCWLGSYELSKQNLITQSVTEGSVFFDIGANVGFYTLLASSSVGPSGTVIAFEPLPSNIKYLERHIELNALENVRLIKAAVSDSSGEGRFAEGPDNCMGKLSDDGTFVVEMVTLDQLITEGKVPKPDFLKIDVEGAEFGVLQGATELLLESHPTVFLATHGSRVHRQCIELLESLGYSCREIEDDQSGEHSPEIVAVKSDA